MKNYRFYARNFFRRISILLISFVVVVIVASRPLTNVPHPAVSEIEAYDTLGIAIDPVIRDSFHCIYDLLERLISEKKGIFREPAFHDFFASPWTRLVFSVKALPEYLGGKSYQAEFDDRDYFRDTIFINKSLYTRMSKEYLTAVIIHEGIHAFITWSCVCYGYHKRFGVDELYLKKHFRSDWESLTDTPYLDDAQQHDLMSRRFLGVMTRHLLVHINQSNPDLRHDIATALTLGGLSQTKRWRRLGDDTCYLSSIDILSRHMNVDSIKTQNGPCLPRGMAFLDSLQLEPLCQ
jgi:hypothetical protein